MKQNYLLLLFCILCFSISFGQDNQATGEIKGLQLYPNPVTEGKVYISTSLNQPKEILIYDVLGTQMLKTTILRKELNLSDLPPGVYLLRVNESGRSATRKLIIK